MIVKKRHETRWKIIITVRLKIFHEYSVFDSNCNSVNFTIQFDSTAFKNIQQFIFSEKIVVVYKNTFNGKPEKIKFPALF